MKYTIENLNEAVKNSKSIRQVINKLGLKEAGGNYQSIKNRILEYNIDMSHFHGQLWSKGKTFLTDKRIKSKYTYEDMFSSNSLISRDRLKKFIINNNLIKLSCCECGNNGEWNNKHLTLELDHINGVSNDNRLENLRFLCPNCHSQTPTFRRKKQK